jgi:hypothetical protein
MTGARDYSLNMESDERIREMETMDNAQIGPIYPPAYWSSQTDIPYSTDACKLDCGCWNFVNLGSCIHTV